ncbi:molybdopterin-dependent oxidoreductase [Maribacter sp. PR1]|uniref:Molybdopterin cofactor-binding domain-containing protein n=1 Tax=Maribacter cobaltidurans TaxID=1178778 RepID=A0ABU7IYX7_9FLAO|nr:MULTISPECIES: molybdopterin cofactor-binding domain-containing protein [Maribacter]MDC6390736.1 molybdopterin-dependent oxidoreductase [Maribacter sp. PR1]MEE1978128.1 molybdopterin cofactor-binding domain-containing protein [Maribacter cobaltidurans]
MTLVKTKIGRRSFIRTSALAGGGMMVGFSWLASCKMTPEEVNSLPKEWFDINGFLKIGDNGMVTIMSPNPEIGQNVKTAMPMIVADELDVDWKNVIVEQAPLNLDVFQRQLAGGSQSIRAGWEGLRMAGATARKMLKQAAAKAWEVPEEEITTSNGMLYHEASNKSAGYGELASAAVGVSSPDDPPENIEVPEEVELKGIKDFTIIGTDRLNVDGPKIVTGKPLFGIDVQEEGMLTAMIVHPPAFGLSYKSMDAESVKSMPGIKDVFPVDVYPEGVEKQWSDGGGIAQLVAIVGESTWQCMQAKKALKVEWEGPSDLESTSSYEDDLAKLLDAPVEAPARSDGDFNQAFKSAAKVIERTYSAPFLAHNTMEPMNFYAHVTADKAEVKGPIQTPEFLEKTLSSVLDMSIDNIDVGMTRMGGGFGRRLYGHFGVEAAVISKKAQAPIKLVYSREDDMTQGTYRPAYKVKFKAGLDKDNNLIAWSVKGAGTNDDLVFENRFPAGAVDNYLAEKTSLQTKITTGAWRAPRSNFMAGAEQSFMDEVAELAGKDPIDFRLELFDRAINDPVGNPEQNDYDPERYAGVLKLVKEKAKWDGSGNGKARGVSAYYCHNSYVAQVLDLSMEGNKPMVDKVVCAVDCGIVINPISAKNQIEGGIIDGIGHATYSQMTFEDGVPQQQNFDSYHLIRNIEAPKQIESYFVDNGIDPTGLGEPSLPPVIGALANAMYKATGKRVYNQPFILEKEIVG